MRIVLLVVVLSSAGVLSAETLTNTTPEFTAEIPTGFVPVLDVHEPSMIAAYSTQGASGVPITLSFWHYGEEIEAKAGKADDLWIKPSFRPGENLGKVVDKYLLQWDGDAVHAAVFEEYVTDGFDSYMEHIHMAWIPLKGEAIQVVAIGSALDDARMKSILQQTLNDLEGPSSGGFGSLPPEIWFVFGPMLLILIGGIAFMVYRGKRSTPRGTAYYPAAPIQGAPPPQPMQPPAAQPPPQSRPPNPNRAPWEQ